MFKILKMYIRKEQKSKCSLLISRDDKKKKKEAIGSAMSPKDQCLINVLLLMITICQQYLSYL